MKKCSVCKIEKDFSQYHRSKQTKDGYGYRCIECDVLARIHYRAANRERFLERSRETNLAVRFGLSVEDYNKILEGQGGVCAICGSKYANGRNSKSGKNKFFSVDHCHTTGKIRGLLCSSCNRGLGLLGDTEIDLEKALKYLRGS